uniref:Uncharacterized protein n=1 Tax=Heterosigma akashiwo TaxID=2829 RepID=A0A6S9GK74_HETAK
MPSQNRQMLTLYRQTKRSRDAASAQTPNEYSISSLQLGMLGPALGFGTPPSAPPRSVASASSISQAEPPYPSSHRQLARYRSSLPGRAALARHIPRSEHTRPSWSAGQSTGHPYTECMASL